MQIKQFSPKNHFIKALVYGASGSGKTSFGGTARKAVFASAEGGLLSIADKLPNYVEIKSLKDLKDLCDYLKNEKHDFETVVIDSITEINDIIKLEIERSTGKSMQLQDWGKLAKDIKQILRDFRDLPMNVLFISQETLDDKNEAGVAEKVVPSLNGKSATEIAYFMDIVGYAFIDKKDNTHRVVTTPHPRYLTKDRSRLIGSDTAPDFSVWEDKIKSIKTGVDTVVAEHSQEDVEEEQPKPQPKVEAPKTTSSNEAQQVFNQALLKVTQMKTSQELTDAFNKLSKIVKITAEQRQFLEKVITDKLAQLHTIVDEEQVAEETVKKEEEVISPKKPRAKKATK